MHSITYQSQASSCMALFSSSAVWKTYQSFLNAGCNVMRENSYYDPSKKEECLQLIRAGVDDAVIAREHGVLRGTVKSWRLSLGILVGTPRKKHDTTSTLAT